MPDGIISVKIDPATGTRLPDTGLEGLLNDLLGNDAAGMVEHFYQEFPPPDVPEASWDDAGTGTSLQPTAPALLP
jgi:penicillin-binding protein 1A